MGRRRQRVAAGGTLPPDGVALHDAAYAPGAVTQVSAKFAIRERLIGHCPSRNTQAAKTRGAEVGRGPILTSVN